MSKDRNDPEAGPSADQVAAYLQANPDFFMQNDSLLANLNLRHASGSAISLLERQVTILRERNIQMRHRLASLVEVARENDALLEKTQRLVISILEANSLDAIINNVNTSLQQDFQADISALTLIGNNIPQNSMARVVSPQEASVVIGSILGSGKAVCGALRPQELQFLFPEHYLKVGSAAVAALGRGSTMGVLAIGSHNPEYYKSSMGTIFLMYVREVLNCVLPRYYGGGDG